MTSQVGCRPSRLNQLAVVPCHVVSLTGQVLVISTKFWQIVGFLKADFLYIQGLPQ